MKPHPDQHVRLFFSDAELWRIFDTPTVGKTAEEQQVARVLREMGRPAVTQTNKLDDLAKKVKQHMELHSGDYLIKPDLKVIGKTLLSLFAKRK